jgi:hypothetical protein
MNDRTPRISLRSQAVSKAVGQLKRLERFDRTAGLVLISVSLICWINAATYHYKTAQHILLALDVICPPFGIIVGALRLTGLL